MNTPKHRVPRSVLTLVAAYLAILCSSASGQSTGWVQTGAGPYDYNDVANWVGGTINGTFDPSLTIVGPGSQHVTIDTDDAIGTDLQFGYAGAIPFRLRGSGDHTVVLHGNVSVNTASAAAKIYIGSTTIGQRLGLDLNGAIRTFSVASGRELIVDSVVANGGIVKSGAGNMTLSSANTYAGGTTVTGGMLIGLGTANFGDTTGGVTLNGGTLRIGESSSFSFSQPLSIGSSGGTVRGYRNKFVITLTEPVAGSGQLTVTQSIDWDTPTYVLLGDVTGTMGIRAEAPLMLCGNSTFTGGIRFSSMLRFGAEANLGGPNSALTTLPYNTGPVSIMGTAVNNLSGHTFSFASNTGIIFDIQDPDNTFTWNKNYNSAVNGNTDPTFGKAGLGTMVITVPQTYGNAQDSKVDTLAAGGTLKIDYAAGGSLSSTRNVLGFSGGIVHLLAKTDADTTQSFYHIKLATGGGKLIADNQAGSGALLVNLGNFDVFAPAAGSSLDIRTVNPGSGSITVATTQANDASGIISGGRVLFNGSDWASVVGGTTLGAYSGYAVGLPESGADAGMNYSHAGSANVSASESVNTLKLASTGPGQSLTIADGQKLTVASGGLLFTGTDDYTVSGGEIASSLAVGANSDLIVHHQGDGTLTIGSVITNGLGASTLTLAGPGTVELTAANRNTGATYVYGGRLILSSNSQLNNGANTGLTLHNAALRVAETFSTGRGIGLGGGGATIEVADGKTLTLSGTVSGGRLILQNHDAGSGVLMLSGANSFGGGIEINAGILRLGNNSALNASGFNTLQFGNAGTQVLQINGARTVTVAGLAADAATAVIENGAAGVAVLNINTGMDSIFAGLIRDGAAGTVGLGKDGGGALTLTAAHSYTGPTVINGGVLRVNGSLAAGSAVSVLTAGVLAGAGSVGGPVTVGNGGTLAPGDPVGDLDTGSLTLAPDATLSFDLSSHGATDRIDVSGDLVLDGSLDVSSAGTFGPGVYTLMTYTGTLTDNGLQVRSLPVSNLKYRIDTATPGVVRLRAGAPGTWIMIR